MKDTDTKPSHLLIVPYGIETTVKRQTKKQEILLINTSVNFYR